MMPGQRPTSQRIAICFWVQAERRRLVQEMRLDGGVGEADVKSGQILQLGHRAALIRRLREPGFASAISRPVHVRNIMRGGGPEAQAGENRRNRDDQQRIADGIVADRCLSASLSMPTASGPTT